MIKPTFLYLVLFLLVLTGCKQSKDKLILGIPDPKTLNETYVSNPDKILKPGTVSSLNEKLRNLDQSGKAHIDVVFVKSIGDHVPKEIAHTLFNTWKIGRKNSNNGLLIFIVEDQHRIEFETGYGLEGILPDVTCYKIQQEYMIPYARQNDYDSAVKNGVDAVIRKLEQPEDQQSSATAGPKVIAPVTDTVPITESSTTPRLDLPMADPDPGPAQGVMAAPQESSKPQNYTPRAEAGNWFSLILVILYFSFIRAAWKRVSASRMEKTVSLSLLFIIPIAFIIYLNLQHPFSWYNIRAIVILYIFLIAYTHAYAFFLSKKLSGALKDKDQHQQYLEWRSAFANFEWAAKVFPYPFLRSFWKKHQERLYDLRYKNINCDHCSKAMTILDEDKDNEFLSRGQVKEEDINSVDYDVWACNSCHQYLTLDYRNLKSEAKECLKCHFLTVAFSRNKTISRATTSREGIGRTYFICANCGHEEFEEYVIARIMASSGSSSSSSSGSSSSSSSSSGSSSSSSSSSSGGSSGGGGAGSSW